MRKRHFITFFFLLAVICSFAQNDDKEPQKPKEKKVIVLTKGHPVSQTGPRMPGRAVLNCEYGEGYISIQLPDWAESAEVTVSENEMPVWFCTMTPQDNTAGLPALNGEYTITCELDDQSTYVGTLVF